jgi:hypothetical protein
MRFSIRTFLFCLLPISAGLLLPGCSEDIRVLNPGPPIPVVYGVFDLNEAVHYIKLTKTFAGQADPYTLALDHDLVFYPDAQVFLTRESGSTRMTFTRETGIPRDTGYFPEYPNEVFHLNQKLEAGNYLLTVILPTEQDTLIAKFSFIDTFKVITPKAGFKRFYLYEDPILFTWQADAAAGLFEITLNLEYEEWLKNGTSKDRSVIFTRQLSPSELEYEMGRYSYRFYSDSFFAHLGTAIRQDAAVDYRKPVGLEMLITAADTTVAKYLGWFHLEIDDKVNPNGNVEGAIGVVGTKFSIPFHGLILSARSQDSLVKGRYTRKLNFINNPDW